MSPMTALPTASHASATARVWGLVEELDFRDSAVRRIRLAPGEGVSSFWAMLPVRRLLRLRMVVRRTFMELALLVILFERGIRGMFVKCSVRIRMLIR